MRNLRSYFKVIFDTPEISDDNLRKFTEVHLQRLATNNPGGALTGLIAATTAAYDDYFGAITDEDLKASIQRGLTRTMNEALAEFTRAVRRREGTIRGEFEEGSATYLEFFPQGLMEYTEATLADVEKLMKRFADLAAKHVGVLGQAFADRFAGLRTSFVAARTAQLQVMGEVKGEKQEAARARTALEDQLMDNLLTLAMRHKRDADSGMAYFDQSIIRRPEDREGDEPPAPGGA